MRLLVKKVPINHNLFLFGDLHVGNIMCHHKGITQLINHMQSSIDGLPIENNIGIHHGDSIDAICTDDKRFDITEVGVPLEQAQEAIRILYPIRKQLITILYGNHEDKLFRFGNLTKHICQQLDVEYGTYSAKITFIKRGGDVLYKHYCTHGRRSIGSIADDPNRRLTNMKLQLKRHLKDIFGDIASCSKGHVHKLIKLRPSELFYLNDNTREINATYIHPEINAEYIHPDLRWYFCTGSFLRLFNVEQDQITEPVSGYAERAEYPPQELGYYIMKVRDSRIVDGEKVVV